MCLGTLWGAAASAALAAGVFLVSILHADDRPEFLPKLGRWVIGPESLV